MLTRREFLRAQMMGITLIVVEPLHLLGSPVGGTDHASHLPWTHYVRIAGNPLSLDRVDQIVKEATETHVFGIETDNDIQGHYESFRQPHLAEKLAALTAMADAAHAVGNYAFVYVTGFECITSNADQVKHSLYKDHDRCGILRRKVRSRCLAGFVRPLQGSSPRLQRSTNRSTKRRKVFNVAL
jgi:hypothetical protein